MTRDSSIIHGGIENICTLCHASKYTFIENSRPAKFNSQEGYMLFMGHEISSLQFMEISWANFGVLQFFHGHEFFHGL